MVVPFQAQPLRKGPGYVGPKVLQGPVTLPTGTHRDPELLEREVILEPELDATTALGLLLLFDLEVVKNKGQGKLSMVGFTR